MDKYERERQQDQIKAIWWLCTGLVSIGLGIIISTVIVALFSFSYEIKTGLWFGIFFSTVGLIMIFSAIKYFAFER